MRTVTVIILRTFVAHANAQQARLIQVIDVQDLMKKMVSNLVSKLADRALTPQPLQHFHLESTTLAKTHPAMSHSGIRFSGPQSPIPRSFFPVVGSPMPISPLRFRAVGSNFPISIPHASQLRAVHAYAESDSDDSDSGVLEVTTVDVKGLRRETERRVMRATKNVAKKLALESKITAQLEAADLSDDQQNALEARLLETQEAVEERKKTLEQLHELEEALSKVPKSKVVDNPDLAGAVALANHLGVKDSPPPANTPKRSKEEKAAARQKAKERSNVPRKPYFRFTSATGTEIRVGRRSSDNDQLSISPEHRDSADWWMHAAGCPGSHIIIRTHADDLTSSDPETIQDAASLALLFSKAVSTYQEGKPLPRGKGKVNLVRARQVSKPPLAKPGLVHLSGDVITVKVDLGVEEKRLERLLTTKSY
eukprot:gnl/MRDRNA2_/MRDRNA2_30294_c0_seq1.p1 gnl/MRDRNA2_/MRDRNA2_30294_c0~~gnl/MRDRNA2_/MRDRNA2_30294_c0_seq1.p1  ORF type:complete len:424 (-),score=79.03 gnl/MRDRNA2_/MRDRNA2_30294_c0_seq1:46-1317(-)